MKTEIIKCDICKKERCCNALGMSDFKLEITLKRTLPECVGYRRYDVCTTCDSVFSKTMDDLTNPK